MAKEPVDFLGRATRGSPVQGSTEHDPEEPGQNEIDRLNACSPSDDEDRQGRGEPADESRDSGLLHPASLACRA